MLAQCLQRRFMMFPGLLAAAGILCQVTIVAGSTVPLSPSSCSEDLPTEMSLLQRRLELTEDHLQPIEQFQDVGEEMQSKLRAVDEEVRRDVAEAWGSAESADASANLTPPDQAVPTWAAPPAECDAWWDSWGQSQPVLQSTGTTTPWCVVMWETKGTIMGEVEPPSYLPPPPEVCVRWYLLWGKVWCTHILEARGIKLPTTTAPHPKPRGPRTAASPPQPEVAETTALPLPPTAPLLPEAQPTAAPLPEATPPLPGTTATPPPETPETPAPTTPLPLPEAPTTPPPFIKFTPPLPETPAAAAETTAVPTAAALELATTANAVLATTQGAAPAATTSETGAPTVEVTAPTTAEMAPTTESPEAAAPTAATTVAPTTTEPSSTSAVTASGSSPAPATTTVPPSTSAATLATAAATATPTTAAPTTEAPESTPASTPSTAAATTTEAASTVPATTAAAATAAASTSAPATTTVLAATTTAALATTAAATVPPSTTTAATTAATTVPPSTTTATAATTAATVPPSTTTATAATTAATVPPSTTTATAATTAATVPPSTTTATAATTAATVPSSTTTATAATTAAATVPPTTATVATTAATTVPPATVETTGAAATAPPSATTATAAPPTTTVTVTTTNALWGAGCGCEVTPQPPIPTGQLVTCQLDVDANLLGLTYNGQDILSRVNPLGMYGNCQMTKTFNFYWVPDACLVVYAEASATAGLFIQCDTNGVGVMYDTAWQGLALDQVLSSSSDYFTGGGGCWDPVVYGTTTCAASLTGPNIWASSGSGSPAAFGYAVMKWKSVTIGPLVTCQLDVDSSLLGLTYNGQNILNRVNPVGMYSNCLMTKTFNFYWVPDAYLVVYAGAGDPVSSTNGVNIQCDGPATGVSNPQSWEGISSQTSFASNDVRLNGQGQGWAPAGAGQSPCKATLTGPSVWGPQEVAHSYAVVRWQSL